ncbi:MAG: tRNA lysidine(34) synthetase TilS [Methyloprofundus sp.]|nr:tRNA lysidine(34) synthetase TilS [Methyloprofundus sp.]MBW6452295.1 tRNA lysidine(34) synthetase TilS [Methyloprofundus sp.]
MKLSTAFIASQLLPVYAQTHLIVGYSGGIDSHVLLHLLASIPEFKNNITAVYVHHGLQACADNWAVHCQSCAEMLGVKFKVLKVNARAVAGESPEEAARNARYQAFKAILKENDVLLFAQHRNDQLETVLLQLFRGAGLKGLSGMPTETAFAAGVLLRPLLAVSQEDITQYALQHQLQWIEDPSNQDTQFDRNFLRHQVMPLLAQRWPSLDKTVARVAGHCAEAQTILSVSAKEQMLMLYDQQQRCLLISGLLEHDTLMQQWIVRAWLDYLGARMPSVKVMQAIFRDILAARQAANPIVWHDGYAIQRYRDGLYFVAAQAAFDVSQVFSWADTAQPLPLNNNGLLLASIAQQGIARKLWQQGSVQIKYRQGGEKIVLPNRSGRHSLKKLYQEAGIAPWLRERMPVIYIDSQLAAIADLWVSKDFYGKPDESCIKLTWHKAHDEQRNVD